MRDAQLTHPAGWIPVDPHTLRVKTPEAGETYAVGDVAAIPLAGRYKPDLALSLPKARVFAEAHGRVVARQIAAKITSPHPISKRLLTQLPHAADAQPRAADARRWD